MSVKILLGAAFTASVGGAVWVSTAESGNATEVAAAVAQPTPANKAVAAPSDGVPVARTAKEIAATKAAWKRRVAQIHAAQAAETETKADSDDQPETMHKRWVVNDTVHEKPDVIFAQDGHADGSMMEVAQQVSAMVKGCDEFMVDLPSNLSLKANVIGAPDVGTVVESVDLVSEGDAPADLKECLTESMYTLDLGETDQTFERSIQLILGSAGGDMADMALLDENLDEATKVKIREAMDKHADDPGGAHVMHFAGKPE